MTRHYDAIIIGAGMSGIAAGIRLAMFGKKVCIFEKHTIAGGLNSFYAKKGHLLDVGLHAMTNYATKGERGKPLTKLLKQLRIPYPDFKLNQQNFSKIHFPNTQIEFTNDPTQFIDQIAEKFPAEKANFLKLIELINNFNEVSLKNTYESSREKLHSIIKDEDLVEMILCPLLVYGSAWENDMDFSQFVIMFKSIYLEGFSRPVGGVRTIIRLILKKYKELGGEIHFRSGVAKILSKDHRLSGIILENGEQITCDKVLSSIGLPETHSLLNEKMGKVPAQGQLSFCETILVYKTKPRDVNINETIVFYNNDLTYKYQRPKEHFDYQSAVICFPNNFEIDDYEQGMVRLTFMANYDLWNKLSTTEYQIMKASVLKESLNIIRKLYPELSEEPSFHDVFTPRTIKKFTGHHGGTVYGSTEKTRDGTTAVNGLYIIGTDQGFLGIVGSMLSGISMANLHVLMPTESAH